MIKQLFFVSVCFFATSNFAQNQKIKNQKIQSVKEQKAKIENHKHGSNIIKCATDQAMEELFNNDPSARLRYELAQKEMGSWENSTSKINNPNSIFSPAPAPLDTIPIVFHILHQGGPENISNQQVYDAVEQLNVDFQKLDADTTSIENYFQARATSCNLVFKLATKDPLGNCTNGIIRHYDSKTVWSQSSPGYSYSGTGTGKWDPRKYMNIYIVKEIVSSSGSTGGIVVGYTYRPGSLATGSASDAIVYNYQFLDVPSKEVRSLAHEIGHWLNLAHTFGSTNNPGVSCGDDFLGTIGGVSVDDTPKTLGAFSTCPNPTPNSCDVSNYANVENIMDYSSCPKMFTLGQCKRMRFTLTATTAGRNNLVSAANKLATGIRNPIVCIPVADFGADKKNVCVGTTVNFADSTQNAQITTFQWDFPGGTPPTSSVSNPSVTYSTPGTYAVTYTATNSAGSNIITKNAYVTVSSNVANNQAPYSESFETINFPDNLWAVENASGNIAWEKDNTVGATGNSSLKVNNFNNTAGSIEVFYTPSYNIAAINALNPGSTFTFKVAHQRKSTASSEKLQVYSTTNCGQTWNLRYSKSGSGLATVTAANTSAFVPTSSQWRTETVSTSALTSQTNVSFKFVFTSDANGSMNNIFIDDINFTNSTVGINDLSKDKFSFNIFPNPNNGEMTINLDLVEKNNIQIELIDILGKKVYSKDLILNAGEHRLSVGKENQFNAGIYFCKLIVNGKAFTQKVIIE
jgi:PKD repeat protein